MTMEIQEPKILDKEILLLMVLTDLILFKLRTTTVTQLKILLSTTGQWTNHPHHINMEWKEMKTLAKTLLLMDITFTMDKNKSLFEQK